MLLLWPDAAFAAEGLNGAKLSVLWALPFVGILLCIATGPVFYPHVWEHHYVMILPAFILLYSTFAGRRTGPAISYRVFWITFWAIALPTPFFFIDKARVWVDPEFYWSTAESLAFHFQKPAAVLVLYGSLWYSLWRHGGVIPALSKSEQAPVAASA